MDSESGCWGFVSYILQGRLARVLRDPTYLPVLAGGFASNVGEELRVQLEVNNLATVTGRAARQLGSENAEAREADEAAVGAAQAEQILAVEVLNLGSARLLGVVLIWAEDGGHVNGANRLGEARLGRGGRALMRSAQG